MTKQTRGNARTDIRETTRSLFIALTIVALIASACSSDSDEANDRADAESEFADGTGRSDGPDSDLRSDDRPPFAEPQEQVEPDAEESFANASDSEAITEQAPESVSEAPADADDGGGLFGTRGAVEPEPYPEPTPTVDSRFTDYGIRTFIDTAEDALSTFALDVDTGSYSIGRRFLREGQQPPRESVRVEEYVNAFDYDYVAPLRCTIRGSP